MIVKEEERRDWNHVPPCPDERESLMSVLFPRRAAEPRAQPFISTAKQSCEAAWADGTAWKRSLEPAASEPAALECTAPTLPSIPSEPAPAHARERECPWTYKDEPNWSPCHCSLLLTALCHGNKLRCCRMSPINGDMQVARRAACARCNWEQVVWICRGNALKCQSPFTIPHDSDDGVGG